MLPIEDLSKKNNKLNGGQFLVTRPETVSNEIKQAKTREELKKNAEKAYKAADNSVIVKNAPEPTSLFLSQKRSDIVSQPSIKAGITAALNAANYTIPKNDSTYINSAGFQYGGQYSNVRASINDFKKPYEPQDIRDYAHNAAKADTAQTTDEYYFYNRRRINNELHKAATEAGQLWMVDQQQYTNWVLAGLTPEEQERRVQAGKDFFEQNLHSVPTFDPSTNSYTEQMQFKEDAPLPPWVAPTRYNNQLWEYYTTYSHDVVEAAAEAYNEARDKGREYERNPYKSAFAESEVPGNINSFLDIVIASFDKGGFDATYEKLLKNTTSYVRDYIWNPLKAGPKHWGTAAGNALWNLMDTMDVASRGVRAFVAGETVLGGSGGREFKRANRWYDDLYAKNWEKYGGAASDRTAYENNKYHGRWSRLSDAKFKGQNVYWAKLEGFSDEEVQRAQTLFMDHGGYSLLLDANQGFASKRQMGEGNASLSDSDRAKIAKELDRVFAGSKINWRDIYKDIDENYFNKSRTASDLKQAVENVKKAYTDVDANFNADTGNLAADVVIETVLDPGLIAGGISKTVTKKGVESAAETAIKRGLANIALDSDAVDIVLKDKRVRGAINQFVTSNEGRNIIFKNAKKFNNDADVLIDKLKLAGVFRKDETAKAFKDVLVNELMNKHLSVNGAIISTQPFAREVLDSKAFKAAALLDRTIDAVDSTIIKSSFFLPWAGVKGSKALGNAIVTSDMVQSASARLGLRKFNAARDLLDEKTNTINVTKFTDLMANYETGLHHEKDVRNALQLIVDRYDDVTWNVNDIIHKFSKGEITEEEAFGQVGELIREVTGGQYMYVNELAGYVDSLTTRYAGDIRDAYGRLDNTFKRLQNLAERRSETAVDGFIDKVRQAQNADELAVLFRENMDNPHIMELRERVIDNAQFNITAGELEGLINDVTNGLFSEQPISSRTIERGIQAQSRASDATIKRTISFDTFNNILTGMGVNWEKSFTDIDNPAADVPIFEKKVSEFMSTWSKQSYVKYNTDDMLKFVDRFERQLQFKMLMKVDTPAEVSALAAHQMVGQFNALRKQLKQLDLVNLKDVKMITLPQMDRMAMNLEFRNNTDIQKMYGSFYDDIIAPIWTELRNMSSDEVDMMDSSLFKDIDELARQKYGFDRTSQLVEEAKTLPGFSDNHLHSFLNTLATDFRFRDDIGNIDLTPGGLRKRVEATLRAQTGESKVGMKNITNDLQSLNSDNPSKFLKNYSMEIKEKPELLDRYNKYVNTDVLDPKAYVEKQILYTALADPSVIPEWNALAAKGQVPIAMHINSTGLNTEINNMTSVAFRKWVPIEITEESPLTLEKLLDALDSGETTVFQRYMKDSEFDEFTEQVIRKLDLKDCHPDSIMKRFKEIYGIPKDGMYKSEDQMIEEVCAYLSDATILVDEGQGLRSVAPVLLVHDLDGFNINYFNNKIYARADVLDERSKTFDYLNRIANSAKENSCNTYIRLAEQVGDFYYTDEQIDLITNLLHDYIDDINYFANGYKFNDMQSYSRKLHKMVDELKLKEDANKLTGKEKQFLDAFRSSGGDSTLSAYDNAVRNIADLGLYPRQYAFLSSDIDENLTKVAIDATGRTSVNTGTRIYVDDVLSYFNLETEDGFYAPIEDLRKMNEVSQYIIRTRNRQIVAGAEEFLSPHKEEFDRIIQAVIDLANSNSYEATKLSYLQNMKIPDNPIDSYLMAKKLYNDHLKYWLDTDSLDSLRTGGKELDAMKEKLYSMGKALGFDDPRFLLERDKVFKEACDFVNNNRIRMFDEVVGGAFDPVSESSLEGMIKQVADEKDEFWRNQITTGQDIWNSMRLQNKGEWQVYKFKRQEVDDLYKATSEAYGEYMQKTYRERYRLRRNIATLKNRTDELGRELYKEATDELEHINSEGKRIWDSYNNAKEELNRELDKIRKSTQGRYDDAELQSALHYADGYYNLAEMRERQLIDTYEELDIVRSTWERKTEGVLDILQGAHEPEIYNWAARSDFEKQVLKYKDGVMKSGLDKAAHYMEANSQIKSEMRQLQHIDEYFALAGLVRRQDRMTASTYAKTKQLYDILEETDFLKRDSFHDFLQKASSMNRVHLQQYRLNSLRNVNGEFDRYKLFSDLVYNGFNMSVFNSYNYTPNEMRELLDFVKDLQKRGDDFLSFYEDKTTGNVFIYLNDNCTIAEADGGRWINRRWKFERPQNEVVPFADFDDLASVLDIEDIEDYRGIYAHLQSCWEDTRILSMGQINGTTGRTVSHKQASDFIESLPSNMNDWLTSEGLLQDELTRGVIYDPGFVINDESDMLTDFLGTLHRQAETAKDDCVLINEVFHSDSSLQFGELAQNFTTDELIKYFGENPEYAVCTITTNPHTATGFQVRQLNLSTEAGVQAARNMQNTTILPYSTYYEISNYMNRDVTDNVYKKLLGKYMLVYKAFALVRPGTWMRNFIDATIKASFDNKEGAGNVVNMFQYEAKAARDIGTYGRIIASDPKLLNAANWDIIQKTFKTDMSFEDFELLRGIMDSDHYKSADKYFLSKTAEARGGFNIISGENIGLRNLEEKDIKSAFEKYLAQEPDLPLSRKQFLDIYSGNLKPDDEMKEQYEAMFRKLSNNLRNGNEANIFEKTVNTMFKPFSIVEESVRYAQALQLIDNGFSENQVVRHIHNTQFYNAPVWGTWRTLENIMPFVTFKFNNMMYWVRMMDENPRLYRYFTDTYRSIFDTTLESALQNGMELDYETDYGLQSGAIPLGNGDHYFNIGSSLFSAVNDYYGIWSDIESLNPLLRVSLKTSMYAFGFNSKKYYTNMDPMLTDEEVIDNVKELIPGYSLIKKGMKTFKDIKDISSESEGPNIDALYSVLNFIGILGVRKQYGGRNGKFSEEEYQKELAKQGKWHDANIDKVVDISKKNEYGANNPDLTFEDKQTYMLIHFGKLWDANQYKFVRFENYQEGGYNDGFDFENDPGAWNRLCEYMKAHGKIYDYNQRAFVHREDYIYGGLNLNLDWDTKVTLMEEKFGLKWDANQQAFVESKYYISGGMNDFSQYEGADFLKHWNELKSLRLALYGEAYDSATHKFKKVQDPTIALAGGFMDDNTRKRYDNYYALLAIPRLDALAKDIHINEEGLLVNSKGQYLLTGNPDNDAKVFEKFRHTFDRTYYGRHYSGWRKYSFNKFRKFNKYNKPYKGREVSPSLYISSGWRNFVRNEGYRYSMEYKYRFQYRNRNYKFSLNRLISPPKFYPYGGGYNKFSFHARV